MANRKNPSPGPDAREAPGFEQALQRLETIVQELEGGDLTLEESLARYEEGMTLSHGLTRTLDEAEKRIERLSMEGEPPVTAPLETELEKGGHEGAPGEGELPF